MRITKKNSAQPSERRKQFFWLFAGLLFAFVSLYVYLVNTAAVNAARWRETEQKISSSAAAVGELETSYLSLKQGVTLSLAYQKGFEDARAVRFISGKTIGAIVRNNEI